MSVLSLSVFIYLFIYFFTISSPSLIFLLSDSQSYLEVIFLFMTTSLSQDEKMEK